MSWWRISCCVWGWLSHSSRKNTHQLIWILIKKFCPRNDKWCYAREHCYCAALFWVQTDAILCRNMFALQWRHNECTGVSNHLRLDCLFKHLLRHSSKKSSKLCVTGLCGRNSPVTGDSPHKGPVPRKIFPFDDAIICYWTVRESYIQFNYAGFYILVVGYRHWLVVTKAPLPLCEESSAATVVSDVKYDTSPMMTSSNANIFRVTGPLCGEFTGHRWITRTKASDAELWCFPWSAPKWTVE